ncbi:hypothetical protein N9955_00055 [bacterium]|nr:hypothetical protein [bacterium]
MFAITNGLITTQGGLISCECCGGGGPEPCDCDPDELNVCWKYWVLDPDTFGSTSVGPFCLTLTGSLCSDPPEFTGSETQYGSSGTPIFSSWRLYWDDTALEWVMEENSVPMSETRTPTGATSSSRCNPAGYYLVEGFAPFWEGDITLGACVGPCGCDCSSYTYGNDGYFIFQDWRTESMETGEVQDYYFEDDSIWWLSADDVREFSGTTSFSTCDVTAIEFYMSHGELESGDIFAVDFLVNGFLEESWTAATNPNGYVLLDLTTASGYDLCNNDIEIQMTLLEAGGDFAADLIVYVNYITP